MNAFHVDKAPFSHLLQTLEQVDFWLTRNGASRLILAAPSFRELRSQRLPEHVRFEQKPKVGRRQPVRGRRNYDEVRVKLAVWPDDDQDENPLPAIACVVSGEADFHIADYILRCKVGDWILLPAGVPKQDGRHPHFEGDRAGRECDILWIYTGPTKGTGLMCWICRSKENLHYSHVDGCWASHGFLARLFGGFCEEAQSDSPSPEINVHLLRGVLMLLCKEIEAGRALSGNAKRPQRQRENDDPIAEALAYMEANLDLPLTIEKIANIVLLSPTTFSRWFKEQVGKTFHEYYTELRLKRAEELLENTSLPISLICPRVGLRYGQFRALFQQFYGCSPGEFRERKQKKLHS